MPPRIAKVTSIRVPGVFANYATSADVPEFQARNLIYGFNGTGKTTLSRILASVASGSLDDRLDQGARFSLKLSDGVSLTHTDLAVLSGQVLVYNGDFVARNFRWAEGEAEPVFFLGKEQGDVSRELEAAKRKTPEVTTAVSAARSKLTAATRSLDTFKTEIARTINTATRPPTQYRANNLEADFNARTYDGTLILADATIAQFADVVGRPAARRPLPRELPSLPATLSDLREVTDGLLAETPGSVVLADLAAHETMLGWVKAGYDYHREKGLDACLFCGNADIAERMSALAQVFDARLSTLLAGVDAQIRKLRLQADALHRFEVPVEEQCDPTVQERYQEVRANLQRLIRGFLEHVEAMVSALEAKKAAPSRVASLSMELRAAIDDCQQQWQAEAAAFAACTEAHNDLQADFEKQKADARQALKAHHLAEHAATYADLMKDASDARTAADAAEVAQRQHVAKIADFEGKLRDHGPAAEHINKLISGFLGHSEIAIAAANVGYSLVRHGGRSLGHLSEGEKTAITVCYFLTLLEADGRRSGDLIVVVDDPISSLDTRSLNYAFNLLKAHLDRVGQLFVLTHNLHFMNEAKKWIRPSRAERDAGVQPAHFLLDCRQSGDPLQRATNIISMPSLLSNYESEYQYLFSLVHRSVDQNIYSDLLFLLPNAMRKVLEIFIAFKVPGTSGLASVIESKPVKDSGIDMVRLKALERLGHVESHGDNLDDIITFSPMTVEETKEAASTLLELISKMDEHHYSSMCRICT